MTRKELRELSSQETYEREKYMVHLSPYNYKPGDVVKNEDCNSRMPVGTIQVVVEEISIEEAKNWGRRTGCSEMDLKCYFSNPNIRAYKTVLE